MKNCTFTDTQPPFLKKMSEFNDFCCRTEDKVESTGVQVEVTEVKVSELDVTENDFKAEAVKE